MWKRKNFQFKENDLSSKRSLSDVSILTDIEGGNICNINRLSASHFSIQMKPDIPSVYKYPEHHCYWFYFKLTGVKDKEVKIDITNCVWMRSHWKKYKPVFSYAEDPDSLAGVIWQRIENTKHRWNKFSFKQRFENDFAWVALRYPYTYTRAKRYIDNLQGNKYIDIEELEKTAMGNSLHMIVVTDKEIDQHRKKGVLVYAREHGVEQDGSWVIEGMIDYLLSSDSCAEILRRNIIFMIVPIISPDSVIYGRTVEPVTGNYPGIELMNDTIESTGARPLFRRIEKFVDKGNTLDICISFHSPHGTEPNIYPHYRPFNDIDRIENSKRLHKAIIKNAIGYTTWKEFTSKSCIYSVGRFAKDFGSVSTIYEVNHQAKDNYLSLEKLKGLGEVFLKGLADYFELKK